MSSPDRSSPLLSDGYVRYPSMRQLYKNCVGFLADENEQRRVIVDKLDNDPWAWDRLSDAINDLNYDIGDPSDEIGWMLRDEKEADALRLLGEALDRVLVKEKMAKASDEETINAPSWPAVVARANELLSLLEHDDDPPPLPSREDVESVFRSVIEGEEESSDAGNWAARWISRDIDFPDPILADALLHLFRDRDGSQAPESLKHLLEGRRDFGFFASDALGRGWARENLAAYAVGVEPSSTTDAHVVQLTLRYWPESGLPFPEDLEHIERRARNRLIEFGYPEDAATTIPILFQDEGDSWPSPPQTKVRNPIRRFVTFLRA